ncbi:hypothetical protein [Halomonas korlensis]|uniref:hypothetical protein n=1 Tax=Halomonas korlensis TaxID=463301 RepID=UPI001FE42893|nr:hypothetical protein [Halomonas korlensis]
MPSVPYHHSLAAGCRATERCLTGRRAVARRPARWWLAGLLVGCLLPASLAQTEGWRYSERIAQICVLAPALIRASSRLRARRRAMVRWPLRRVWRLADAIGSAGRLIVPPPRAIAGHDVLTRRGPPQAWAGC